MTSGALDHIRLTDRPLVVCDVDDVVLEFLAPFQAYLLSRGHRLIPRSFRLHGNIVSAAGDALAEAAVSQLILDFFDAQEHWQTPLGPAIESLKTLSTTADIVFLTAMPPSYVAQRRRLLDRLDLGYPLVASLDPKGPLVQALHAGRPLPVAFVDDMVRNLHSVGESVSGCLLVHLMPESEMHRMAPAAGDHVRRAADWDEATLLIGAHIAPG